MEYQQDPYMDNILNCTRILVIPLVYLVNVVDLDIFESKKWVLILLAIFLRCGHEGISLEIKAALKGRSGLSL